MGDVEQEDLTGHSHKQYLLMNMEKQEWAFPKINSLAKDVDLSSFLDYNDLFLDFTMYTTFLDTHYDFMEAST